ncbi:MAG: M14 family metallopeptidase [Bacteroidota bacterium]
MNSSFSSLIPLLIFSLHAGRFLRKNGLLCLVCGSMWLPVKAQDTFTFQGTEVPPGTKAHIRLAVSAPEGKTTIPVTLFHGAKAGPVLGITAGVHGYEYAPILAAQKLIHQIDPSQLSGTVILVQIANVESFSGRSPYINPKDGKNLNRVFPGKAEGSMTERVAHIISEQVIARSDFFLDMHSGDAPEDLRPYTAYYHHDDHPGLSDSSRQMALHMGFDHVIKMDGTNKDYLKPDHSSLYCSAEAFKRGIPAMDIECGRLGIVEEERVEKIVTGVLELLKYVRLQEGTAVLTPGTLIFHERSYLSSPESGIFYPLKSSGDYVEKGMKLGYITDFFGNITAEVFTEKSGVILYMLGTPPVNKGETLASIGLLD